MHLLLFGVAGWPSGFWHIMCVYYWKVKSGSCHQTPPCSSTMDMTYVCVFNGSWRPDCHSGYFWRSYKDKWFSIPLLKPYCDRDQNTYRAHNRNKYHHCVQRSLSNRLIAAGFWFMSSRKREGMLCHQRDTTRSWAQGANHPGCFLTADCRSWNTLTCSDIHPGCISIWNNQLLVQRCLRRC